jgi:hypothetical protein
MTLNRWLKRHNLQGPILLKIDVQGSEMAVLRGATDILAMADYLLTKINLFQIYEGQASFADIYDLVRSSGFEFVDLFPSFMDRNEKRSISGDWSFCKR